MAVVAKIFNKEGKWIDEVGGIFTRSWILNDEGACEFEIALDDPKCTLANLEFGNYIVIEAKSIVTGTPLPVWGGMIDTPRDWSDLTLKVHAYTMEHVFKQRIGPRVSKLTDQFGILFKGVVKYLNRTYPTLVRPGDIFDGGKNHVKHFNYDMLYDMVQEKLVKPSLNEWSIDPVIDASGLLYFAANWYEKKGVTRSARLEEGHNIEFAKNMLVEDGDIINHQYGDGKGSTIEDRESSQYDVKDETSIARYGPRQAYTNYSDQQNERGVKVQVDSALKKSKNPRRTFRVAALDKGETFANIALGDTIPLRLTTIGWNADGTRGVSMNVRVKGIAYADDQQKMELTLDEVLE